MSGLPNIPKGPAGSKARIDALAEKAKRDAEQEQAPSATDAEQGEASSETTQQTEQQTEQPAEQPAEQAEDQSLGPVGSGERVVQEGECVSSIAKETGHFWETIWQDAANTELREARGDPNVLLEGDRLHVPELRRKEESGETEMRHRFVRRGEPANFRMIILVEGEPKANEPYTVEVDGDPVLSGTTGPDGLVEFAIPGNAREGVLRVGEGDDDETFAFGLQFGVLEPVTEARGVQQRLQNLGYPCGPADGIIGERTQEALKSFQRHKDLEETGEPDEATRSKLEEVYGT